jgi:hypothetical protein
MKNTAILLCGVPLLLVSACTASFAKARAAINDAPEWYEARRTEIRGEGYPEVSDIPRLAPDWQPEAGLKASGRELKRLKAMFDNAERAQPAPRGAAEIAEVAAQLREAFGPDLPPAEFLTEAEIAAIRASFDVPRVTEGVITP